MSTVVLTLPWHVYDLTEGPAPWADLEAMAAALASNFDEVWPPLEARFLASVTDYDADRPLVEPYALATMQLAADRLGDGPKRRVAHALLHALDELMDGFYVTSDTIMKMSPTWQPWIGIEVLDRMESEDWGEAEADVYYWGLIRDACEAADEPTRRRIVALCRREMNATEGNVDNWFHLGPIARAASRTGDEQCRSMVERALAEAPESTNPFERIAINEIRQALENWGRPYDDEARDIGATQSWLPGWVESIDESEDEPQYVDDPVIETRGDALAGWLDGRGPSVVSPIQSDAKKVGRNAPCPCGSGKKYKKCCGR